MKLFHRLHNLDFLQFLGPSSERGFLQLNKFLGRAKNALPSKFITLEFTSLWNLNPKIVKSRDKRHIVLLEVLIAFALVALCVLPLIYPHVFILRSEKKFVATVELDHVVNLLYAEILQKLYQNEIPWQDIESGKEIPIEASLLEPIGYGEDLLFTGTYQFVKIRQKPRKPSDTTAYLYSLKFTFLPKPGLFLEKASKEEAEMNPDKIVYKCQVAMERKLK